LSEQNGRKSKHIQNYAAYLHWKQAQITRKPIWCGINFGAAL
jgi:hypothetical protein